MSSGLIKSTTVFEEAIRIVENMLNKTKGLKLHQLEIFTSNYVATLLVVII